MVLFPFPFDTGTSVLRWTEGHNISVAKIDDNTYLESFEESQLLLDMTAFGSNGEIDFSFFQVNNQTSYPPIGPTNCDFEEEEEEEVDSSVSKKAFDVVKSTSSKVEDKSPSSEGGEDPSVNLFLDEGLEDPEIDLFGDEGLMPSDAIKNQSGLPAVFFAVIGTTAYLFHF